MKGENDIAKVGCGIQMKEVTSHELLGLFLVVTSTQASHPRPITSGQDGWLEHKTTLRQFVVELQ